MRILLVNDDGYTFPNILALEEILNAYGEVFVFAPTTGMSGAGCGLNTFRDMKIHKVDDHHYNIEGMPVDCVQFADYFLGDVDLVVSGVNQGFNLSNDIMYSGTCGAAFQSVMFRRKAIALSADPKEDLAHIKAYAKMAMDFILSRDLTSTEYFLNVNFPCVGTEEPKGFELTSCYIRRSTYTLEIKDEANDLVHLHRHHNDFDAPEGTDVHAVVHGSFSITPMGVTCYRDEFLADLKRRASHE